MELSEGTKGLEDPTYVRARNGFRRAARASIDRVLAEHALRVLVAPTTDPAWLIDLLDANRSSYAWSLMVPIMAGYPILTVPMGQVRGMPVGISFIGPAWSESRLLGLAYAYEQTGHARQQPSYATALGTPLPQ